jgi:AraC-like DNA-binding protein
LCREAVSQGFKLSTLSDKHGSIPKRIIECREYLDTHFKEKIKIDQLSNMFNYSSSHLRKCFKEYAGKSIVEYINHRRIQMAMFLLKDTSLRITDICYECGFNEMSFFNRKFKSICGQSAREFRSIE